MPYDSMAMLPEAVKKLPEHAQEIWMKAFNSAHAEYGSDEKAFAIAWSAVEKAGYKNSVRIPYGETIIKASKEGGYKWRVRVIKSGVDLNQRLWSEDVLKGHLNKFEGCKVFMLSEAQHSAGHAYGKPPSEIVGWIQAVFMGSDGIYGDLVIVKSPRGEELRAILTSSFEGGKEDLLGLSVDIIGKASYGGDNNLLCVESIENVTVDVVYEPAAGGNFIKMAASKQYKGDIKMTEEELKAIEASKKLLEEQKKEAELQLKAAKELSDLLAKQKEEIQRISCATKLDSLLRDSGLPEPVVDKLKACWKDKIFQDEELKAAIKLEKETLDKLTASLPGSGSIRVNKDDLDKRILMLDDFFDGKVKSFRSAYVNLTGDESVTGVKKNFTRLTASLDSTSFSSILGDSITRKMVKEYNQSAYNKDWRKIAYVTSVSDFRTNRRDRMGGYGNLPTVSQGAAYTALTSPTDEEATYTVTKRGGTEDVTLEMIKNDDMGSVKRIPTKLAMSAVRTLAEFVWDFLEDNPTIYDATALFTSGHGNLGSSALDATALAARRRAMLKQTELSSSKRLGIPAKYVIVPVDLDKTCYDLIATARNSDFDPTSPDFTRTLQMEMIVVPHWTDTNNWFLAASPSDIVGLEISFLDGKEEPELYVQDQETVGSVFTNDKITFKMRHIYGGAVLDYRAFDGSIVT